MTDKKSNTQYLQLQGIASWAKVFEQNRDKEGPNGAWRSHGGMTTITLTMDKDNEEKLAKSKSQKKIKRDEDGNAYVQFTRKWEAPYSYGGAPQVVHADGTDWDIEEDGLIGNGSEVVVYLQVYEAGGYWGTRLDGVQVIEHVPYEVTPSTGGGIPFKDYTKGTEAPAKPKKAAPKKKEEAPAKADLDDEIPF